MQQLQRLLKMYWGEGATEPVRRQLLDMLNERDEEIKADLRKKFETERLTEEALLDEAVSENILKSIHEKIRITDPENGSTAKLFRFPVKMIGWAAAIIICLFSAVALFKYPLFRKNSQTVVTIPSVKQKAVKTIKNKDKQPLRFVLSDSSVVVLFSGSSLSYKEDFDAAYRSLTLKGSALFKVARDTSRPFTVYANGVATTALGTEFCVNTLMALNKVHVRLLKGKVVIRSFFNDATQKDIYLKPGQECTVDNRRRESFVSNFKEDNTGRVRSETRNRNFSSLEFSKEPLVSIFKKLEKRFNVEIKYTKRELNNLSFTGHFKPTDSLLMMLTVLCNTNDLFFEQDGTLITVSK